MSISDETSGNTEVITKPGGNDSKIKMFDYDISVRAVLAGMLVATACTMSLLGKKVEEPMYSATLMVLGLYFGQKKI